MYFGHARKTHHGHLEGVVYNLSIGLVRQDSESYRGSSLRRNAQFQTPLTAKNNRLWTK